MEHLGQINTGALESSSSLFPVPADSKPQLEQVCSLLQLGLADVCVPQEQQKAAIFLGCDAVYLEDWLCPRSRAGTGGPSCPSAGPVWNLFGTEKYLALKRENVIWKRLIVTGK